MFVRTLCTLFLGLLVAATLSNGAFAIGSPQLVPTCIKDAAKDYTLINDPKYAITLQSITSDLRENTQVVFISCESVDGLYAFRADGDSDIPDNDFIVYSPSFIDLATQENKTKLLFLLAHEYAHITLGHFTTKKKLSLYEKELQADDRAACSVARVTGDIESLRQIIGGLRGRTGGTGYPSLADSMAAVQKAFNECAHQNISTLSNDVPRSRVSLISPTDITTASVGRSIQWLSSQLSDDELPNIRGLKLSDSQRDKIPDGIVSLADIDSIWGGDNSLFLVLEDSSSPDVDPTGPTFSGLFFLGPFGPEAKSVVVQFGSADGFTDTVKDAARENVRLTEKISAVALSFAALKYGVETKQPKEVLKKFVTMAKFALSDLRRQSHKVSDFAEWTRDLSRFDALVKGWDS